MNDNPIPVFKRAMRACRRKYGRAVKIKNGPDNENDLALARIEVEESGARLIDERS